MEVPGPSAGAGARMTVQPPGLVFLITRCPGGSVQSTTPLALQIAPSPAVMAALRKGTATCVGTVRRFDMAALEVVVTDEEGRPCMAPILIPQSTVFKFSVPPTQDVVNVQVRRKLLPLSVHHGNAPLVLVFAFEAPGLPGLEVVHTTPFITASKEASNRRFAPLSKCKRRRGPGACLLAGRPPPDSLLHTLDDHLGRRHQHLFHRRSCLDPAPEPRQQGAEPDAVGVRVLPKPRKRMRAVLDAHPAMSHE